MPSFLRLSRIYTLIAAKLLIAATIIRHPKLYWTSQAALLAWSLFWCFRPSAPGKAVVLIALAATFAAVQPQMTDRHRIVWLLIAIVLCVAEFRAIDRDRIQHDTQQKQDRAIEAKHFQSIADGLSATITQAQQQFQETMKGFATTVNKEEKNAALTRGMMSQFTGGATYPEVTGTDVEGKGVFSLNVIAVGKYNLSDVDVYVRSHVQKNDPQSILTSFEEVLYASTPMVLAEHAQPLALILRPEGNSDWYQIDITARNGSFMEMLVFSRNEKGQLDEDFEVLDRQGRKRRAFKKKPILPTSQK